MELGPILSGDNVTDRYDEVENDYITCIDEEKSH